MLCEKDFRADFSQIWIQIFSPLRYSIVAVDDLVSIYAYSDNTTTSVVHEYHLWQLEDHIALWLILKSEKKC